MNTATMRITEGMEAIGTDGEKIGEVKRVWANPGLTGPPDPDTVDRYAYGTTDVMGNGTTGTKEQAGTVPSPDIAAKSVDRRYFRVDQGGILGVGVKELYIPFAAVVDVVPDTSVTVSCTKDRCSDLYSTKPDFLEDESPPLNEVGLRPPM